MSHHAKESLQEGVGLGSPSQDVWQAAQFSFLPVSLHRAPGELNIPLPTSCYGGLVMSSYLNKGSFQIQSVKDLKLI